MLSKMLEQKQPNSINSSFWTYLKSRLEEIPKNCLIAKKGDTLKQQMKIRWPESSLSKSLKPLLEHLISKTDSSGRCLVNTREPSLRQPLKDIEVYQITRILIKIIVTNNNGYHITLQDFHYPKRLYLCLSSIITLLEPQNLF